jgi:hypothetical protein
MVYDVKDEYIVMFGGDDSSANHLGDTWKFQNNAWTNISSTPSPPPEAGAVMVYDAAAGFLLLYCDGYDGDGSTWKFSAGVWSDLNVTGPPTRNVAYLGYDATNGYAVLFGGFVNAPPYHYLNDTWKFVHGVWTKIRTPVAPSPRADVPDGGLVYDGHDGYLVLFGGDKGFGGTPYYNDTWKFVHGSWSLLHPRSAPPARAYDAMRYDPRSKGLVMFGGLINRAPTYDTWFYSNGSWSNATPRVSPTGAQDPSLAFDSATGRMILFGGDDSTNFFNQTWAYR